MSSKIVLKALNQRPIAYYPIYKTLTGTITGSVALSQLMYWLSTADRIYKTDAEIMEETGLTQNEFRAVKKKLKKIDFLIITREGIPAKTWYEIDWELYEASLVNLTKLEELDSLDSGSDINSTILYSTENTTKTTSDISPKPKKNSIALCDMGESRKTDLWNYMRNFVRDNQIDPNEVKKFTDYCNAHGKTYKDWNAGFRNWCNNVNKYSGYNNQSGGKTPTRSAIDQAIANRESRQ